MPRRFAPVSPRFARLAIVGLVALAGLTCRDRSLTGPGLPSRAHLAMAPRFSTVPGAPSVVLGSVRAEVFRHGEEVAILDTIALFAPGDTALQLDLSVTMLGPNEAFGVRLTAFDTSDPPQVVFAGFDTLVAHSAEIAGEPASITLEYAGADTIVSAVSVFPEDTTLTVGDEFTFRSRRRSRTARSSSRRSAGPRRTRTSSASSSTPVSHARRQKAPASC